MKKKKKRKDNTCVRIHSKVSFKSEYLLISVISHNTCKLVFRHTLFKKVGLTLEWDKLHKVKGILNLIMFAATKLHKESVSHKLNVLAHEMCIHTNETHRLIDRPYRPGSNAVYLSGVTSSRTAVFTPAFHSRWITSRESKSFRRCAAWKSGVRS